MQAHKVITSLLLLWGLVEAARLPGLTRDDQINGVFDTVNATYATGWACDPSYPREHLTITVLVDGNIKTLPVVASLQREQAVGDQCGGNSFHGFSIQFSDSVSDILNDGQPHTVAAFAYTSGNPVELRNSPLTVQVPSNPIGFLDVANTTYSAGWSCDPLRPSQTIIVEVIIDGSVFAGSVYADYRREYDVAQRCGGDSFHGWSLYFSDNLVNFLNNGQHHEISAFAVPIPDGELRELTNSPISVHG